MAIRSICTCDFLATPSFLAKFDEGCPLHSLFENVYIPFKYRFLFSCIDINAQRTEYKGTGPEMRRKKAWSGVKHIIPGFSPRLSISTRQRRLLRRFGYRLRRRETILVTENTNVLVCGRTWRTYSAKAYPFCSDSSVFLQSVVEKQAVTTRC